MTSRAEIDGFLAQQSLAIAGVSRTGRKFGNTILKDLTGKGYRVFPVHPEADLLDGVRAYKSFRDLPEPVGGVILVVPKPQAVLLVKEAAEAGIPRVWLQQGAESEEAVNAGRDAGLTMVAGECILMFAKDAVWIHRAHRWVLGVLGKLPA
jgi:predicted CoA-binding protein